MHQRLPAWKIVPRPSPSRPARAVRLWPARIPSAAPASEARGSDRTCPLQPARAEELLRSNTCGLAGRRISTFAAAPSSCRSAAGHCCTPGETPAPRIGQIPRLRRPAALQFWPRGVRPKHILQPLDKQPVTCHAYQAANELRSPRPRAGEASVVSRSLTLSSLG